MGSADRVDLVRFTGSLTLNCVRRSCSREVREANARLDRRVSNASVFAQRIPRHYRWRFSRARRRASARAFARSALPSGN